MVNNGLKTSILCLCTHDQREDVVLKFWRFNVRMMLWSFDVLPPILCSFESQSFCEVDVKKVQASVNILQFESVANKMAKNSVNLAVSQSESGLQDVVCHKTKFGNITELEHLNDKTDTRTDCPKSDFVANYSGLVNEGATCYVNSMLQSLFCTNEFRRIIYHTNIESEDISDSFLFWLKYIFYAMQFRDLPKITTKQMIRCFDWADMTTTNEQDIQEFLRRLLDKIVQFVDGTDLKDRLRDLFVGVLKTTTKCQNVSYSTSKTQEFWDIQLPIDKNSNINDAFRTYLSALTIDE